MVCPVIAGTALKGGAGKTTLIYNLAGATAQAGLKPLLCDLDPQHSLSNTLIDDVYALDKTVKDLLSDPDLPASKVLQKTRFENIDIIPSNLRLGTVEAELYSDPDSQYLLADKLEEVKKNYDIILIDCPPSLGIFTRLALVGSDFVLIPLECASYSVMSTADLLDLISKVSKRANPQLKILGFVLNRVDTRRKVEQDYRDLIRQQFGEKVFKTELKDSARYAEAAALKIPINFYQPRSEQAEAYRQLLSEIRNRGGLP